MSQHREPPRLLDPSADADPLLREALSQVSGDVPSSAQVEALAERTVSAVFGGGAAPAATATLSKGLLLKLGGLMLLGGALIFRIAEPAPRTHQVASPPSALDATVVTPLEVAAAAVPDTTAARERTPLVDSTPQPPSESELAPARAALAVTTPPRATEQSGAASTATSRAQPQRSSSARKQRLRPSPRSAPSATSSHQVADTERTTQEPPAATAPSELSLITLAQQLLAKSPQRALAALEEHRERYPRGTFAEERDALQLDALARLGWSEALNQAGRAFLQRYPTSLHRERVQQLLR